MSANLWLTLSIIGIIASFAFNRVAQQERPERRSASLQLIPTYGARREFTSRGWRFRNLTISAQVAALAALILWWWSGV